MEQCNAAQSQLLATLLNPSTPTEKWNNVSECSIHIVTLGNTNLARNDPAAAISVVPS
jgi:hypothetical protein